MRVSKNQLKNIVKECLVEILSEGIQLTDKLIENNTPNTPKKKNVRKKKVKNQNFDDNVSNAISTMTKDPVLASIFEDTAKTTLQEQYNTAAAYDPNNPSSSDMNTPTGDTATRIVDKLEPEELPGAENWAKLAFMK
jgi:uncharacterized membrane protein